MLPFALINGVLREPPAGLRLPISPWFIGHHKSIATDSLMIHRTRAAGGGQCTTLSGHVARGCSDKITVHFKLSDQSSSAAFTRRCAVATLASWSSCQKPNTRVMKISSNNIKSIKDFRGRSSQSRCAPLSLKPPSAC